MHCYVSRKAGPDIAGKTEFVTGKQFKRKSLVYQNKAIRKKPIPQLIKNSGCETSWNICFSTLESEPSSVFWLMFSSMLHQAGQFRNQLNILLLASKHFLLTSQELLGAGMNCRALS
jgi:hypothetical protein